MLGKLTAWFVPVTPTQPRPRLGHIVYVYAPLTADEHRLWLRAQRALIVMALYAVAWAASFLTSAAYELVHTPGLMIMPLVIVFGGLGLVGPGLYSELERRRFLSLLESRVGPITARAG